MEGPRRSAHDAIRACQGNIRGGYKYVVDMDLEKFFDTVNQENKKYGNNQHPLDMQAKLA